MPGSQLTSTLNEIRVQVSKKFEAHYSNCSLWSSLSRGSTLSKAELDDVKDVRAKFF